MIYYYSYNFINNKLKYISSKIIFWFFEDIKRFFFTFISVIGDLNEKFKQKSGHKSPLLKINLV